MDTERLIRKVKEDILGKQTDHLSKIQLSILLYIDEASSNEEKMFWSGFSQILTEMMKTDENPYSNLIQQLNLICMETAFYEGLSAGVGSSIEKSEVIDKIRKTPLVSSKMEIEDEKETEIERSPS